MEVKRFGVRVVIDDYASVFYCGFGCFQSDSAFQ